MTHPSGARPMSRAIGSYRLYERIGAGGMGTVHLGRRFASGGFRRIVAIKRLHPHLAEDVDFVSAFLDEARLASRIHHPNVVAPIDVVAEGGEVFLVFEHVLGLALSTLAVRAMELGEPIAPRIAAGIMVHALHGLHEAHEARGDDGAPLGLVHRDVSPHNVLVGKDGTARLLDFGVAKAHGRLQITAEGVVKGKRAYMAPEHLLGRTSRASDLYSAAVVLWELLAGRRLWGDQVELSVRVAGATVLPPSDGTTAADTTPENAAKLDAIVLRGLAHLPEDRYATAREMAIALEDVGVATAREIGEWVERVGRADLEERARLVAAAEQEPSDGVELASGIAPVAAPRGAVGEVVAAPAVAAPRMTAEPIAVATAERSSKRRVTYALAAVVVVVLFGISGLVFARQSAATRAAEPAQSPAAPSVASLPAAPVAPTEAATVAGEPPSPAAPSTSASGATSAKALTAARPRPTAAPVKKGDPPCKPYVIDKDGRKQFNEACLH